MASKHYRSGKKKSICEISILLVANVVKLSSSLRIAGLSLSENLPAASLEDNTKSVGIRKDTAVLVPKSCTSQRSQEAEATTKPRSYLVKPEKEDPSFVRHEIEDIDATASSYIRQIREKIDNGKNYADTSSSTAGKRFSGFAIST